jgi:hypothetical protein
MTATFGDFLRPAGEHIAAAVSIHGELSAEATFGVIGQFGRLLCTLVHYLDDLPVPDEFEAAMAAEPLSPQVQTVVDTRIALRRGAQSLRYAMNTLGMRSSTTATQPSSTCQPPQASWQRGGTCCKHISPPVLAAPGNPVRTGRRSSPRRR